MPDRIRITVTFKFSGENIYETNNKRADSEI